MHERQRLDAKFRKLQADVKVGKERIHTRDLTEQGVANLLKEIQHFIAVDPAAATKGYLVEKLVRENNQKADAVKIMGLL
jgi:hypothetical protein